LLSPLSRIVILAIAAASLNLILGFGGMVSFGHAIYLGIGAYAVGILDYWGVVSGWAHLGAAIASSAALALVIGALSLRVSGLSFIMITLAFSQMAFYIFTVLVIFGGDEGMSLSGRSQFIPEVPLKNPLNFYFFCLVVLAFTLLLIYRIVHSRFGRVIQAAYFNEKRTLALGYPVMRFRLVAYMISAVLCAVAGVLFANLNQYVSSETMRWTVSGDLIVMIIIGGLGSVAGPVIGAGAFIALQELLSAYTDNWQAVLGIVLIVLVIFAREGVVGFFDKFRRRHG
jgi:branched-chain amino acid transport system permease protein